MKAATPAGCRRVIFNLADIVNGLAQRDTVGDIPPPVGLSVS